MADDNPPDDDPGSAHRKCKADMERAGQTLAHIMLSITERSQALFDEMKIDADPTLAANIASLVFGPYGPPTQAEDDASGLDIGGHLIPPLALGRFYCRQLHYWITDIRSLVQEEWQSVKARRAEFPKFEDWYESFDDAGFFPAAMEPEPEMWRLAAEHFAVSDELQEELVEITNRLMVLRPWTPILHRKIGKLEVYRGLLDLGLGEGNERDAAGKS